MTQQLNSVRAKLRDAEKFSQRREGSVRLVAVSKTVMSSRIVEAIDAGQFDFAENYLQDAVDKIRSIADPRVCWHFIGRLQSNKIKRIAECFSWVHSLSHAKHVDVLNRNCVDIGRIMNVCVQVNVNNEKSKSGVSVEGVDTLVDQVMDCSNLKFRGLMCIAQKEEDNDCARGIFEQVAALQKGLKDRGIPCDTLSMGMSDDYAQAIAAGSTMIRIGSAIFGPRGTFNA